MNQKIDKHSQRFNREHQYYKNLLQNLTDEQLAFRLSENKWSIIQTIYHVYLSESSIIDFILQFSFERKSEKLGFTSKFSSFLTNAGLRSSLKFKAPTKYLETFPEPIDKDALMLEWSLKTESFDLFLRNFDDRRIKLFIFKHPLAGKFNLSQTLGFMYYHKVHHRKQIEKLMKQSNYPKAGNGK